MRLTTLLATSAASGATALLGALATDPDTLWYRTLRKPTWQPPTAAFPAVWTPLYADLAVTAAVADEALAGRPDEQTAYRRALAANLALNAGWSWTFWRSRQPWAAAAECALLTASSVDLVRRTARADRRAGLALAPYAAWCGFATALSTAIAVKNPGR